MRLFSAPTSSGAASDLPTDPFTSFTSAPAIAASQNEVFV